MNKSELVDRISVKSGLSKKDSSAALDATLTTIGETLAKGDSLALLGFGTFSISERVARTGKNPKTGEPLQIKAAKVPRFKAGKALRDLTN